MLIHEITKKIETSNGSKITASDSYSTGKYDPTRVCDFCQEYIDQFEASTALQVEGDHTSYQRCNDCKEKGVTVEAASEAVSTISSVLKNVKK